MKKSWKKTLCLSLACTFLWGGIGCSGATVTVDDLYIPKYEDESKVLKTLASVPPNFASREQAQLYKDAGFNYVFYAEDFVQAEDIATLGEDSSYLKGLRICEELGLDVIIQPHHDYTSATPTDEPCYYEKYFSTIDFRDYPAVKGFFVVDEPVYGQLVDMEDRYLKWFNENYGGYFIKVGWDEDGLSARLSE